MPGVEGHSGQSKKGVTVQLNRVVPFALCPFVRHGGASRGGGDPALHGGISGQRFIGVV